MSMASCKRTTGTMTSSKNSTEPERVQKFLARAGVASRRRAEELIREGRVRVNGEVVSSLSLKVDPDSDTVTFDGARVTAPDSLHYVLLNKPAGVVTTLDDPQGRPSVAQYVSADGPRLFPVGRLDQNTTGLLVLTNDGELAHALMHPRYHVPKTYQAVVAGVPDQDDLRRLRIGIDLDDGRTAPADVRCLEGEDDSCTLLLTLHEGRKRQVRRMLSAVGHPVLSLARVGYGPLTLEGLVEGETRELTEPEIEALRLAAGGAR